MLAPNTNGTLWEEWWRNGTGRSGKFQKRTRSDAQTESVFPPALFAEYILGVAVTKPGMKEFVISKPTSSLHKISGSIPTPNGFLFIDWDLSPKKILKLDRTIYERLQILSVSAFDKTPINQLLTEIDLHKNEYINCNQLKIFDL